MARSKSNGNGRLEEAIAILLQHQASFLARASETDRQMAETNQINAERFARIEALLLDHNRILTDHTRILQALTDAVREKIGFSCQNDDRPHAMNEEERRAVQYEKMWELLEHQREQGTVLRYSMNQAAKVAKENPYH